MKRERLDKATKRAYRMRRGKIIWKQARDLARRWCFQMWPTEYPTFAPKEAT